MKAFITVVDDNGRTICKDQMITPVKEEIVGVHFPTKEARFNFTIRELADFQLNAEPTDLSFKGYERR